MDVELITQELYGLKPAEFAAARDAYVAEARRRKEPETAKAIAALRRPVLAAWAANLLARERPEEAERFLALGETLRVAHRMLDGARLREAARKQHQLVATLARTAADLAAEAGQPVSDPVLRELEQTLHGVLARPEVAREWARGRLVKVPEAAVDFTAVAPEEGAMPAPDRTREKKREAEAKAEREAERKAEREAEREAARKAARKARDAAAARAERAGAEVRRLEQALDEARREAEQAAEELARLAEADEE